MIALLTFLDYFIDDILLPYAVVLFIFNLYFTLLCGPVLVANWKSITHVVVIRTKSKLPWQ